MDFIFYGKRKFKYHINTLQLKNILYVRDFRVYKINFFYDNRRLRTSRGYLTPNLKYV